MRARAGDGRNDNAQLPTETAELQPGRKPACLLSVEDLAAYLQVPIATIYQWRYKGDSPDTSTRPGRDDEAEELRRPQRDNARVKKRRHLLDLGKDVGIASDPATPRDVF